MTSFGYTLSSEEHPPGALVAQRAAGRGGRVRLRVDLRPLPPVGRARRATARSCGRCSARSPRPPSAIEVGIGVTCPIDPHPPGDPRPGRGHDVAAVRRPLLPRRRHRRGAQRARPRRTGGRRPEVRREMLEEAVEVIRGAVDRRHRRPPRASSTRSRTPASSTRPTTPLPVIVSGFGDDGDELAGRDRRRLLGPRARPRGRRALPSQRRDRPAVRAAQRLLGRRRGAAAQDRARDLAERRHPRPARPGPADLDALRAGRRARDRGRRHDVGRRAAPTSSRSSSRSRRVRSTPATTTSTSTRSAPTRTASSGSGTDEPAADARRSRPIRHN